MCLGEEKKRHSWRRLCQESERYEDTFDTNLLRLSLLSLALLDGHLQSQVVTSAQSLFLPITHTLWCQQPKTHNLGKHIRGRDSGSVYNSTIKVWIGGSGNWKPDLYINNHCLQSTENVCKSTNPCIFCFSLQFCLILTVVHTEN